MPQTPDSTNLFQPLVAAGYPRLLPVIPPGASISPHSKYLFKRVGTPSDPRGKVPGILNGDGSWHGINFTKTQSDPDQIRHWASMGASCGVRLGQGLAAIDVDTIQPEVATRIVGLVEQFLGLQLPKRYGRRPKVLMPIRVLGDFTYQNVRFLTELEQDPQRPALVELLAEGKHFVAAGLHPVTGLPYEWPDGVPAYDDLPQVTAAQLEALFTLLADDLKAISTTSAAGLDRESVNQEALRAPVELVAEALARVPNTSEQFPARDDWLNMGYAIKAACGPGHDAEAFDLWLSWSDRWEDGDNDRDEAEANWDRMHPPFGVGASWIFDKAKRLGGWTGEAAQWFEPLPAMADVFENPFLVAAAREQSDDVFPMLTLADIASRSPPVFLIDRYLPATSMGFLYSEPGVGKSFLALDMALTLAAGMKTWQGHAVDESAGEGGAGGVLYIASEGSFGFRNRVKAWLQQRRLTRAVAADVSENAFGKFRLIERTIDFMDTGDVEKLIRTVQTAGLGGLALVVVDTVSRSMPGADENLQKEMTLFVRACDRVKDAFGCCVLGVHHAGKNGDMRGSTVLRGAGDFVLRLSRERGAVVGALLCEKQKDGEDGWTERFAFDRVVLGDGQTSLVVARASDMAGVAELASASESVRILAAMRAAWLDGVPWSEAPQTRAAGRFALALMEDDYGIKPADAKALLKVWKATGVVRAVMYDSKTRKIGLEVAGQDVSYTSSGLTLLD